MSLETATGTALEKLKELMPQIAKGEEALEHAAEAIDAAVAEVEEGWEELQEQAQAFIERTERRGDDAAERMKVQEDRIARLVRGRVHSQGQ